MTYPSGNADFHNYMMRAFLELYNVITEDQTYIGFRESRFFDKIVEHKNSINLITSRDVEKSFQMRYPKKDIYLFYTNRG